MNKKEILIISLLICVIFSISAVSAVDVDVNDTDDTILAAQEDTDVVAQSNDLSSYSLSNTNETILGDGETGSFKDLQNLIGNDTTGTITLDKNYTYNADTDYDLVSSGISVAANKIIQGNGQNIVIDGKGIAKLFQLSGTITLKGITFINGFNDWTSPIYSSGSLTVSNCTFINNSGMNGGALWSQGSLTMEGCTFINNTAPNGGAIQTAPSPMVVTSISDCKFINNTANIGGSLHTNGVQTILTNIEIYDGTADMDGGAIYIGHRDIGRPPTNVRLTNITIRNSNAANNGGAIMVRGSITSMNNITITDCSATNGGAIYFGALALAMDNLTLTNNTATTNGGAIYFWPNTDAGSTNGLTNSILTNNSAGGDGGAIYAYGNGGEIVTTSFINNDADNGGAVYVHGNNWRITDSTFISNSAHDSVIDSGNGGAIMWDGHNGIIDNVTFTSNNATHRGGAVFVQNCDNVTIANSRFNDNFANVNGGAVEFYKYALNGIIVNSTFNDNIANRSGGAVYWYGDTGDIINVSFTGNKALGNVMAPSSYGDNTTGGDGGAIMWTGQNGIVDNCTFTDNYASQRGGAVFLQGSVDGDCINTTFSSCDFISNEAGLNGGAIDWHEGAHDGLVTMSNFKDNIAASNGGAIFWSGHNGRILHSNFTNNSANGLLVDTHGNFGDGGAIIWSGINGTVDYCRFIDNNASQRGGGVFLQNCTHGNCTNTTFYHVYFENNYAGVNGGAIDWHKGAQDGEVKYGVFVNNTANRSGGAIFWFGTTGEISHSNFTGNKALGNVLYNNSFGNMTYGGHGGAVMWTGADGVIDNCTFDENRAKVNGGAIFMQGSTEGNCSNIHISNVKFGNNFAGVNGGAVDWYKGAYNCTLENATFTNNVANRSGGAVFWFGRLGSIKNAIFTNNSALGNVMYENSFGVNTTGGHGGAIMWTGADGTIDNCTFISNKAKVNGGAVFMQGSTEGNCSNLHISNVICEDNFAGVNGGAIDWYKGAHDCILENATFENNVANRSGGAVYYYGVNGTIKNATFNNNKALGLANATSSYGYNTTGGDGGAVMWTGKDGKFLDSTFKANNASSGGGAIFLQGSVEGNCSNMTIDNCAFEDNYAGNQGGAVNWYKGAHDCTLSNSTFINNTAERSGGALYWYGENGTIKDSVFIGNNTAKGNIGGLNPYGVNTTGGNGGAILWTGMNGNIDNCTFIKNNATNNGGAIYLQGSINGDCSNVTITKGTFIDNVAGKNGGAVDFYQGAKSGRVINSTFINNTAVTGNGGAIFWNGTDGQIINSSFNNNHARFDGGAVYIEGNDCLFANSTLDNNTAGDDGGAIFWTGQRGKMYNITANNNSGISKSDALDNSHSKGGTIIITGSNMAIDQLVVTNSFANEEAGGLFLTGNNVNLTNIYFANCSASTDGSAQNSTKGGAMEIIGNNTRIINATIENSLAEDGGGIYWSGHDGYAYNITATNNTAIEDGGALYISGDDCLINASTFTDNVAGDDGGAIYWKGNNGIIDESSFVHNIGTSTGKPSDPSTSKGGTISIIGNNTDIFNSNFSDSLTKNRGNENTGGAIFITGDDVDIEGCNFNNCTAEGADGGTIYIIGDRTILRNSNVTNSTARAGGAIYIEGDSAQIYDSSFDSNYAKSGNKYVEANLGGAIFIEGDDANISGTNFTSSGAYQGGTIYLTGDYCYVIGSSFDDSYAEMDGGAMYSTGSYSSVYYCEFTNNSAQHDGGGIYWYGGSSSKYNSVVGCIFTDNVAYAKGSKTSSRTTFGGGALYWSEGGSYGTLRDSKFYNNSVQSDQKADGGAVLWDKSSHGIIDNCIFVGNYVTSTFSKTMDWVQGGALFLRARTNFTVSNCDFINSSSLSEAGAAYLAVTSKGTAAVPVEIYVVNTTFVNNVAKAYGDNINGGGAIQLKDADTIEVTFRNVTFINNTANKGGGIVVLNAGNNIKFYDCRFEGNNASEDGGGLWANKAIYMYNTTFSDGYAGNNGGGLYSTDVVAYDNMTFINNTAYRGGGLYWNRASVTIRDMEFINNTAYQGGAIYIPTGGVTVSDVNCTDNKAFSGSAIYSTTSFTLKDSYLMKNQANSSWDTSRLDYYPSNGTVELLFEGFDNYLNGIYVDGNNNRVTCQNVIYWDGTVNNTGSSSHQLPYKSCPTPEAGQNFTIRIYDNDGNLLINHTDLTDLNGRISLRISDILPDLPAEQYDKLYVEAELTEEYYTAIEFTTRGPCEINASATNTTYHSNTTLSVNLSSGANGNVSVYLNDTFVCNITLDADSKGSITISTLLNGTYIPAGNHTLTFNYTGNYRYLPNSTTAILEINKITPTIIVNVTEDSYCIDVNVTVFDEELDTCIPTGTVTLEIEGRIATIRLVDGKGSTRIAGIPIGNYTLNATYSGDINYNSVTNSTDANITTKQQTVVYIDVDVRDIYWVNETVHINVTVFPNATGNVTLYLNGVPHNLTLHNSTASFDVTDLIGGPNHILVTYNGDTDYAPSWGQASFYVLKFNATVGINTTNITLGDTEVINFTLPENATGILNVTINGTRHYVEIINGTATLPVYNLPIGVYNVTAIFNGDRYYYNATNSTLFNVTKATPSIIVSAENITYGENATVIVTLPDGAIGNVTIKLNETIIFTEEPIDGKASFIIENLKAGNYTIVATFNGNENYTVNSNSTKFTVFKATPVVDVTVEDIYYGDAEHITITVNTNGTVTVKVAGGETTLNITTEGNETFVYDLAVGNYPVEVTFNGNENYTNLTVVKEFNVYKANATLDVEVADITVWDKESINVTLPYNATGNVTININGVDHIVPITNGTAQLNLTDLTVGLKTVWVFYDGDRNYTANKTMVKFNVGQRTPTINITAQNITVGEDGNITVKVPANATGYVIIEIIGENTYFKNVTNGQAVVYPQNLKVGNYTVKATYYGISTDNYTVNTAEANFTVKPIEDYNITVIANNITYGENATVIVTLPSDATGNVTIYIDGVNKGTVNLTNGIATLTDIAGLKAGQHEVNVTYNGNERYASKDKNGTIFHVLPTDDWTLDLDVEAHKYGEDTIITVTLPENAKENVTLEIDGVNYTVKLTSGVGELRLNNLSAGLHEVNAYYPGDENYTNKTTSDKFIIDQVTPTIIINATTAKVGENATINITVSGNATGNVTIYVDGQMFERTLVNHTVTLNVTDLASGKHNVVVFYKGDQNYTSNINSTSLNIIKDSSDLTIVAAPETVVVGKNTTITVTSVNVTSGNVIIEVNGVNYTVALNNGVAQLNVTLPAGDYTAKAYFLGDDKYNASTNTSNVFHVINKTVAWVNITADTIIEIDNNLTFTVTTNSNATLVVKVNGVEVTPVGGVYTFNGAVAGNYTITAEVAENDYYTAATNSSGFVVYKHASEIASVVVTPSVVVGKDSTITVTMANNETGSVMIEVNGYNYTVAIKDHVAQLNVTLPVGDYTAKVYYPGDDKYNATSAVSDVFHVVNKTVAWVNITAATSVEIDNNLTFTVITNSNATLVVKVNGVEVTPVGGVYTFNGAVAGNYTITAEVAENDYYTAASNSTVFTVYKHASEIESVVVTPVTAVDGHNTTITVTMANAETGSVLIEVNGLNYTVPIKEGVATLTVTLPVGDYTAKVYYSGDDKYNATNAVSDVFHVVNKTVAWVNITAPTSVEIDNNLTFTVTTNSNATLVVKVNGVVVTPVAGVYSFNGTVAGNYTITAEVAENDYYTAATNSTVFTVYKHASEIESVVVTPVTAVDGHNTTITVTMANAETGSVLIEVNGLNYTVPIKEGVATLTVTLPVGDYTAKVYYPGDDKYNATNAVSDVFHVVNKTVAWVNITADKIIEIDNNLTFTITTNSNATLVVKVNGVEVFKGDDGKYRFNGTVAGNYTITAEVAENDYFTAASNSTMFTVIKHNSTVSITVGKVYEVESDFNIIITNNTAVVVTINGKEYAVVDGKVNVTTAELPVGHYIVTATIAENDKYYANSTTKEFDIIKHNATIDSVVVPVVPVVVGKDATITVTMGNVTAGSLIIEVGGHNYTVPIVDKVAQLNVTLPVGDYTAKAYFLGDDKYNPVNATSAEFSIVNKTVAWVNITADKIIEIDNNLTFTITTNSNATLVVKVNGVEVFKGDDGKYRFNGTVAGNYTITAEVAENDYFTAASNSTMFTVIKHNSTVSITVGKVYEVESDFNIIITNNTAVVVTINGKEYVVTDGKVVIDTTVLPVGHYIVTATIAENDKYYANSTTKEFDIIKHNATIESIAVPTVNVGVGKDATITVTMGNVTTGSIIIEVGGHNYTVPIVDKVAELNVTLPIGDYTAKAYYLGDDKYNPVNATSDEFSVKDKEMPTIIINAPEVVEVDNNIVFTITNSTPVNVTVNGVDVELIDGKYTYNATVAGIATIIVRSAETDDYYEGFNATIVNVIKHNSTVSIDEVPNHFVGDEFNITINNNTSVVVTINGKEYSVVDGKVVVDTTKLPAGEYTVTATVYENDKYYGNSSTVSFNITKRASSVNITVGPEYYVGDVFNITIENNTAVNVTINGKSYLIDNSNGNIIIDTSKLPAGEYIVTASVAENDKYFANATSKTFNIIKKASDLIVVATPESVVVGKNTTITVTMANNETGSVIIEVNGVNYTVAINDHVAKLNVTLPAGDYTVKAYYSGDDYYNASNNASNVFHVVDKTVAWVNITAPTSVEIDNNLTFTVTTNSNATLVVKVNGVEITPVGGVYSFNGTVAGNYTITAEVAENDYYTAAENSTVFTVYKHASEIESVVVTPVTAVDGHNTTITVTMANAETGNVLIEVNGLNYTVPIKEGVATLTVTLPVGDYTAKVYYPGDDKYNDTNAVSDVFHVVNKTVAWVNITADSIIEIDNNITFTVTTNSNATLVVKVNGVEVVKGADSKYRFNGTVAGNYTITAEVAENDYYTAASNSTMFTVIKHNSTVAIDVGELYEIESDFNIIITNNTAVVVTINGKDYAVVDGKVNVNTAELPAGHYIVTATIAENDKYYANSTTKEFDIIKHNATIDSVVVPDVDVVVGKNATITVTMGNVTSGSVIIEVGGHNYTVPIVDKVAQLNVTLPAGDYTAKAYYLGDDKYNPVNATSAEFSVVDKTVAWVNITADSIIEIDNNLTFTVTTNSNATLVVKVNGVEVVKGADGKYRFNGTVAGNYTITAEVAENDYYTAATNSTMFTVIKHKSTVKVDEVPSHYVGDDFEITLTNNTAAVVTINGKEYAVKDGKVVVDTTKLPAGEYTVTATVYENDKYYGNSSTVSFKITKRASSVNVTADPINVNETAVIDITGPSDFNGTAIVNVDGMNYSVALTNGVGQLRINGLANGTYDINVTYLENDKYLQSVNDTVKLLVNKVADAEISASADNITVGDPAVIKVTVPEDATGNVTVTIGNITRTVPIAGGENEIIVPGVPVGDYDVKVTYNGDDKYLPANTTTPLSVKPVETDPADIKVVDQGNGTVVVVVPKDATGNVTITINGTNYTAPVVNGTATFDLTNETPGTYNVTATYSGDENYTGAAANGTVTIPKYETPMSIEVNAIGVGNVTKVIVTVPENVTGNVTVEIDGKTYSVKPVDGKTVFEIEGLTYGNKTVVAGYAGDDWYLANSTTAQFTVDKVASSVNVTGDVIKVDETATIVIAGPSDYNGTAVVTIDGKDYSVNMANGAGQLKVDGLANATYDVNVTLLENDKYLSSSNDTAKVIVNKVSDAEISASADNITVGDPAVIKVTVPEDATGNVTVTIGNITRTVPITGGENEIIVPGVPVGDHEVKVTYNGDDKYLPANTTTSLTVKPSETSPDDIKVIDQGNGTVVVVVPANATGNVTLNVNGTNYTAPVVNGTATFDLTDVAPGTYDVTATYSGDENHTAQSADGKVTIPKYSTPMSIEVGDGKVGETIEVTVNVPENATGKVTVEVNGQTYTKDIADGKAVFEVTGLLSGNKTVTATYDGDDSYLANATTANFTVNKNPAPISVEVDNSTSGQAKVIVTLPDDATGYVIVNVYGRDYGINLTDGDKSVKVPIQGSGDYTAIVTYLGDEKYLGNSTEKDFYASSSKTNPNIAAEVDNVPVGEDVNVKVTIPEGGDGDVTVTIGNITKTVSVTGGENVISIPGVSEGTHDVKISYSGNDQYEPQDITKSVTVFRSINAENITRGWNSPYDYKAEFLDKTGHVLENTEVQFIVNGKTYTVKTDSQGIAFLDTSKLPVGKYDVTIINPVTGEQTNRTTTIVKRLLENKDITMDFRDGTYYSVLAIGDDGKPVGEGEFVDIYVNTIHYSCRTDKDGYARLQINLNPKKYTITAEYKLTKVSNKLVVKQTLKLVKKTVKVKKGKKLVLKAKLKWSNGKAIKGKVIKFKFKGKTYKAKTNSKGIAKVTIKKKVTKKLKKGKKYKYSAAYVTNIVKGTVKVK